MELTFSDYIRLFSSFTNPFSIFLSGLFWAIGTFVFFLLLVIFLRKFILVKRNNKFLKYLSWTYFLIPVVAVFFGFKFGILNGTRKDLKEHVSAYTQGLDGIMNESLGKSPDEFISELITGKDSANLNLNTDQVIDRFSEVLYAKFGSSMEAAAKEDSTTSGKFAYLFLKITKSKGVAMSIKYTIRELLYRELGIDKDVSKEVMETKFKELLQKGLFTTILEKEIDHLFVPWEKTVVIIFLCLLLFPLTETIISNIIFRRKMKHVSIPA
ncbi:MAG TPA: hypothetical protein VFJ43_02655 [Bacteroidia bacterium]|nr:hypothetical protein [Bacteroidia bacterium]